MRLFFALEPARETAMAIAKRCGLLGELSGTAAVARSKDHGRTTSTTSVASSALSSMGDDDESELDAASAHQLEMKGLTSSAPSSANMIGLPTSLLMTMASQ